MTSQSREDVGVCGQEEQEVGIVDRIHGSYEKPKSVADSDFSGFREGE